MVYPSTKQKIRQVEKEYNQQREKAYAEEKRRNIDKGSAQKMVNDLFSVSGKSNVPGKLSSIAQ